MKSEYQMHIYVIISFVLHAIFIGTLIDWSLYKVVPGGGTSLVEVGIVETEGGGGVLAKPVIPAQAGSQKRSKMLDPHFRGDDTQVRGGDKHETGANVRTGSGEGDGGSSGLGSTDHGPGDPRLTTIWKKINRKKYYPEIARRQSLQGSPKVSFNIGLGGQVENVNLVRSCGHDILDKAALKTISRSSPLPFYPKTITIAVKYALDK